MANIEIIQPARNERGHFLDGHNNPHGYSASDRSVLKLFRAKSEDAANVLYDIMMSSETAPSLRAFCAVQWLNRAFGTPKATVEVENAGRNLEEILQAIAARREAGKAENPDAGSGSNT